MTFPNELQVYKYRFYQRFPIKLRKIYQTALILLYIFKFLYISHIMRTTRVHKGFTSSMIEHVNDASLRKQLKLN